MSKHISRLLLVIGLPLPVLPAAAQTALPELVVSANQSPQPGPKVGSSVTVLTGDELRERNYVTAADALRTVPGLSVDQAGGRGTLSQVRIRGAEANHLMVIIDGIEVNGLGDGGFDFADLLTDDIERIEVVRGPQSGLYGANAHSGVISIITRSGKGLARPQMSARLEGGQWATRSTAVNARGAGGPFYGSVTVSEYETRGQNISRFGAERDGSKALLFTGKAGVDVTPFLNLEGVFRATRRSADSDPQNFTFGSPFYGLVVDGDEQTRFNSIAARLGATLTLFDGRWVQAFNVKRYEEATRGLSSGAVIFGADGVRNQFDYRSTLAADTNLFGGEQHKMSVLFDHRREEYQQLFSGTPYIKQRLGLAGEYILDLPTQTTLSGALRHDWNSGFADVVTWRVTASQRIGNAGTRLHASAGKGLTDPNSFELFGSTFNLPNPALLPEQSIGWDAGIEQSLAEGKFVADVTYFSSTFTNKIELAFDPVRGGFLYANGAGSAQRQGIEVLAKAQLLDWLGVTATYTFTDARDSAGVQEIRRPPHAGSLQLDARFAENRGRATLGVIHNGTRKDIAFTPFGTSLTNLPGATILRASASYDVHKNVSVFARAENLLDTRYEEVFSYRTPGFQAYAGLKLRTD